MASLNLSLSLLGLLLSSYSDWVEPALLRARLQLPLASQQKDPTPREFWFDARWRELAQETNQLLQAEFQQTLRLAAERSRKYLPHESPPPASDESEETSGSGRYGQLPSIRVDQGHGAIFPGPPKKPTRFSWISALRQAQELREALRELRKALEATDSLPSTLRRSAVTQPLGVLLSLRDRLKRHAQLIRYLETWSPALSAQAAREKEAGRPSTGSLLKQALEAQNDPKVTGALREVMRPRRLIQRPFFPEKLEPTRKQTLRLPIATDITDPRFRAEIETALEIHWNQSHWARSHQVQFKIDWKRGPAWPRHRPFQLEQHLARFPQQSLILTTGSPSTYVQGNALLLGPGALDGRTIAHELGHLIGFADCYFRTLSGQGFSGLAVLEWENPFFPDELMCDNELGAVNQPAW